MDKNEKDAISTYTLASFYQIHKNDDFGDDFGLNNTSELIENGFGLYSSVGSKPRMGPIRSEFYRLGIIKQGNTVVDCGLESYQLKPNSIFFTFPNQVFSIGEKSSDFLAFYIFFTEEFISDALSLKNFREQFPFYNYESVQQIFLEETESLEIVQLFLKINMEIKNRKSDIKQAIQLYLQLILITANRSYTRQQLGAKEISLDSELIRNFKKLVSQHFILKRNVADYANPLNISPDHLNKTLRIHTGRTVRSYIEEMLLLESKVLLMHTDLNVAEIAWQLAFTDPSHFNKFFKKLTSFTPFAYRNKK